jgi:hypothetical protein
LGGIFVRTIIIDYTKLVVTLIYLISNQSRIELVIATMQFTLMG